MAEAAVPKTEGVMLFHGYCGCMVSLGVDKKRAWKISFSRDPPLRHGPVFSEDPMEMGRLYQVCLEEVNKGHSVTSFGVVTQRPDTISTVDFNAFQSSVLSITHNDVWCLGRYKDDRRDYLRSLPQYSRVGLALDRKRTLHLFLNGQNMGVIACNIPLPCYFMCDIFKRVHQIAALPVTIIDELNQDPKQTSRSDWEPAQSLTSVTTALGWTGSLQSAGRST